MGIALFAIWLVSLAAGPRAFDAVHWFYGSPIGLLILFVYTWVLMHHMLGGMRHLVWDTGRAFQIWQVNVLSWLTIILSVALTLALWAVGLSLRGGL